MHVVIKIEYNKLFETKNMITNNKFVLTSLMYLQRAKSEKLIAYYLLVIDSDAGFLSTLSPGRFNSNVFLILID